MQQGAQGFQNSVQSTAAIILSSDFSQFQRFPPLLNLLDILRPPIAHEHVQHLRRGR